MERKPHHRCQNCGNLEKGFCEAILEPLKQNFNFEGLSALHMPDSGYCRQYHDSDEFLAEEAAAVYPERQVQEPPDARAWGERQAGGGR